MYEEDRKEDKTDEPILSKYKKPMTKADEAKLQEKKEKANRLLKEKQRIQGRNKPILGEEDHERSLMLIATKGVVQLFNTVSEFQASEQKQAQKELNDKNMKFSDAVLKTGEGQYKNSSNKSIVEKLQAKPSRWRVLDPENDGESDIDSDGNIKIEEVDESHFHDDEEVDVDEPADE